MKKYYRSRQNNMIGGVCGGLGNYFNVDPIFIRILFVFLSVITSISGIGILLYIILWAVSVKEPMQLF